MKIRELYSDMLSVDLHHKYKAVLGTDSPVKWAKTLVAYANGEGECSLSEFQTTERHSVSLSMR